MIDLGTVFILGSGSSKPYNFPTDSELRSRIIKDFENDCNSIPYPFDLVEVNDFILRLQSTEGTLTTDEFLSINSQFEIIGKIAIQHYVLEYERDFLNNSRLKYVSDWFEIFLRILLKECIDSKNPAFLNDHVDNFTFLTFNYDRVIEYIFVKQFVSIFKELLVGNINKHLVEFFLYRIIHIYGSLGHLPLKGNVISFREVEFGEKISSSERINETLLNIRLIKDGLNDYSRIEKNLKNAKKIYLLGIGYIERNMQLLNLESNLNFEDPPQIYGTAYEKDEEAIRKLKDKYFSFNNEIIEPILEPITCKELIEKYL